MPTVEEVLADLQGRLDAHPERTAGVTARFQFDLTGEGGGLWHLRVDEGRAQVGSGPVDDPDATAKMTVADFVAMNTGELDGGEAYADGRLRVTGDTFKAMRLAEIMAVEEDEDPADDW